MSELEILTRHYDEGAAKSEAARLVRHGVGATVEEIAPSAPPRDLSFEAVIADDVPPDEAGADLQPADGAGGGEVADAEATPAGGDVATEGRWCVQVLAEDVRRACAVIGIDPPEDVPDDEPSGTPWKLLLGLWLAALIILPLLAFWITITLGS